MPFMGKFWGHLRTVMRHKRLVAKGCFQVGLYRQGILHDMSKFSPTEFFAGVRYFQGNRSPNTAEREAKGYSAAWLHHKGRNKHHYEYWTDYSAHGVPGEMSPVPMPDRYIAEMIMDRIAASRVYKGADYTDACPLEYYYQGTQNAPIHPQTREKLLKYLEMLAANGQEYTFARIREELVHKKEHRK